MIFDGLKGIKNRLLGQKPMDEEEKGMREVIERHPALMQGTSHGMPLPPEHALDRRLPSRALNPLAGRPNPVVEMEKEYEREITPEEVRLGISHSGPEKGMDELRKRLGMDEMPPSRPPEPPAFGMAIKHDAMERPGISGKGKALGNDEEMEMVMKQLDMIRSQNELILQKLKMIERKLGL